MDYRGLSIFGRRYVALVVSAGTAAVVYSLHSLYANPVEPEWLILAALTLVSGSLTIRMARINATVSLADTFVFASVLLFGPAAGTATIALAGLASSAWQRRDRPPPHRVLFGAAAPALAVWVTAHLFYRLAGMHPLSAVSASTPSLFVPHMVFASAFFLLNSGLNALVTNLEQPRQVFPAWRREVAWLSLGCFSGASAAFLLVSLGPRLTVGAVTIVLPVVAASYLTYSATTQRMTEADRHVKEVGRLQLSAIETLAMAVDAKDQMTVGHVRRVQRSAMRLADALGVRHEPARQALAAASLLHDTGKLAVPEYILNKPGPLTPAEFETMKAHASVGADMLSGIEFAYPVVPIVRHHHENWDGTGYPGGLAGTAIPFGARILAVADCFDALTSDRPYRPKLPAATALAAITARRGTMYDPVVVDALVRLHGEIVAEGAGLDVRPIEALLAPHAVRAAPRMPPAREAGAASATTEELTSCYELARALGEAGSVRGVAELACAHVARLVPGDLAVVYVHEEAQGALRAAYVSSPEAAALVGARMPLGQATTGWVGAYRQAMRNALAALDLGPAGARAGLALRQCLAVPLVSDDKLAGVLSIYSAGLEGFTADHERIVETMGRIVAPNLARPAEAPGAGEAAGLTRRAGPAGTPGVTGVLMSVVIVAVDERAGRRGDAASGDGGGGAARLLERVRPCLRSSDAVFPYTADELLVLLTATGSQVAWSVARRIERSVSAPGLAPPVRCGVASSSADGESLEALIAGARRRLNERRAAGAPA